MFYFLEIDDEVENGVRLEFEGGTQSVIETVSIRSYPR